MAVAEALQRRMKQQQAVMAAVREEERMLMGGLSQTRRLWEAEAKEEGFGSLPMGGLS